eukprot:1593273-Pleurochrysis_carterae.AAC.1
MWHVLYCTFALYCTVRAAFPVSGLRLGASAVFPLCLFVCTGLLNSHRKYDSSVVLLLYHLAYCTPYCTGPEVFMAPRQLLLPHLPSALAALALDPSTSPPSAGSRTLSAAYTQ